MVRLMFVFIITAFTFLLGNPVPKTEVYLERGNQLIAFQATGDRGKVSFKYLDEGSYKLSLIFPQQEGKFIKEKPKHKTMTKATYNPKTKTYYYQGTEGFYSIKFIELSKIKSENFKAVFREEKAEDEEKDKHYNVIAEFGIHASGGAIGVSVEALTAAQFKKAADKIGQDISTQSILGIK